MASSLLSFPRLRLNTVKAASTPSLATTPSITESLNEEFGRKGISFRDSNGVPTAELRVRNGSSLQLRISDGHVTSYLPKVSWKDDGFEEALFTVAGSGGDSAKSRGGIGLVINEVAEPNSKGAAALPPFEWAVKDVETDAIDALQVELSSSRGALDITYVVTLYSESMATAVIVKNKGAKPVKLTNAILSHFKFKRQSGAAIQGLRGCSYCSHPPLSSPFELLSPAEAMKSDDSAGWFSFGSDSQQKPGSWSLQDVPFTILSNKFSRVYAAPPTERLKAVYNTPPSKYETIDQGRELCFRVIRMGFEDIYVSSPGSMTQKYGKDYFICTGPASMLVPVTVKPGEQWRGAQVIEHDNL